MNIFKLLFKNKIVIVKIKAAKKFEKINRIITEVIEDKIPNINAWFLLSFPVGIGLRQVLVINLSRSASYHMFNVPAAPAPTVTKKIQIKESNNGIWLGEVNKPTAQVKITKDITLGFINCNNDFKDQPKIINGASDLLVEILGETFINN